MSSWKYDTSGRQAGEVRINIFINTYNQVKSGSGREKTYGRQKV